MKALELLREYQYADDCLNGLMAVELKEAIAELEEIQSRISCDNCQKFDPRVDVCFQNGCKDFEDWELWTKAKDKQ